MSDPLKQVLDPVVVPADDKIREALKTLIRHGVVTLGAVLVLGSRGLIPYDVINSLAETLSAAGSDALFSIFAAGGISWSVFRGVRLKKLERVLEGQLEDPIDV